LLDIKRTNEMEDVLKNYKDLLIQKRDNQNTQDIYYSYFKEFCMYFRNKKLLHITTEQINSYILDLINPRIFLSFNKTKE